MKSSSVDEHDFLWTAKTDRYVLIELPGGEGGPLDYVIYDRVDKGAIVIEDDDVFRQVVEKMIDEGVKIYDRIPKA